MKFDEMIFNSNTFLLAYLPATLFGFYAIGRHSHDAAISFLALASLFFYAWWNVYFVPLLLGSILVNFAFGRYLTKHPTRLNISVGVAANLALLGYFKYANFFIDTTNAALSTDISLAQIALPLAISFFTFQQIAFLVDVYRGEAQETSLRQYALFVSFFPQLIAGPIVHHKEMMPQFAQAALSRISLRTMAVGLTLFSIGLFKKVGIADQVAAYSDPIFQRAESGEALTFFTAWGGALSYHFQIYFDFSGYSDMALGLACLFGIRLPVNFYSPYKAFNIIEFWHRWNITLSRFLRDYLYIPLGGSRHGVSRRYINLMATMLLGGLWHGAGWNFVVWGGLHGLYLAINHGWHALTLRHGRDPKKPSGAGRVIGTLLTFVAVVFAWVFFRAESFGGAQTMIVGMAGLNGIAIPEAVLNQLGPIGTTLLDLGISSSPTGGLRFGSTYLWIMSLLVLVWLFPNSIELLAHHRPALNLPDTTRRHLQPMGWRDTWSWTPVRAVAIGLFAFLSLKIINAGAPSAFIYFVF